MNTIKKMSKSFHCGTGEFRVTLDLINNEIHFLVSEFDGGMKDVDYQEFEHDFHSVAHIAIKSDDLRAEYLDFDNTIKYFIDKYCSIVGC